MNLRSMHDRWRSSDALLRVGDALARAADAVRVPLRRAAWELAWRLELWGRGWRSRIESLDRRVRDAAASPALADGLSSVVLIRKWKIAALALTLFAAGLLTGLALPSARSAAPTTAGIASAADSLPPPLRPATISSSRSQRK